MHLTISNQSDKPIYEQIVQQIKGAILSGELSEGDALPSLRLLAKELRISVITTKRAYEELEREGFLCSVAGQGVALWRERTRTSSGEEQLRQVESHLQQAVQAAQLAGLEKGEFLDTAALLWGGGLTAPQPPSPRASKRGTRASGGLPGLGAPQGRFPPQGEGSPPSGEGRGSGGPPRGPPRRPAALGAKARPSL